MKRSVNDKPSSGDGPSIGRWHRRLQTGAAAALVIALSGCAASAHQRMSEAAMPMSGGVPVSAALGAFLDNAATGSTTTLQQTPWGANVSVQVRERYFAASGRSCIRLDVARNVAPASLPSGEIACQVSGKGWYAQRLVTEIIR